MILALKTSLFSVHELTNTRKRKIGLKVPDSGNLNTRDGDSKRLWRQNPAATVA